MNACTFLLKPHHVLLQEAPLAAYWHNHTDLELWLKGQRHFCSLTSHYVLSIYMFNTSFNLQEQRAIPTTYFHSISQNISKAVRVLFSNVLDYNLTRFPWEVDVMFLHFLPYHPYQLPSIGWRWSFLAFAMANRIPGGITSQGTLKLSFQAEDAEEQALERDGVEPEELERLYDCGHDASERTRLERCSNTNNQ